MPLDYKKQDPSLYRATSTPVTLEVPELPFLFIEGKGAPAGHDYQHAVAALYALSYAMRMAPKQGYTPPGYEAWVVPPLESLWWSPQGSLDWQASKEEWLWKALIRQPQFITAQVVEWARNECRRKKPDLDATGVLSAVSLIRMQEGLCVQALHIGPYSEEHVTFAAINAHIQAQGLQEAGGTIRPHHEIYLNDPRKTAPEKLKTILRLPVVQS